MPTRSAHPVAVLVAALSLIALPPAASAKPIVPGATPLWVAPSDMAAAKVPARCPTADEVDGRTRLSAVRAAKGKEARALRAARILIVDGVLRRSVALACDPTLLAAKQFATPIGGDSALTLTDSAWWGQRALVPAPRALPAGLHLGDHLTLPAQGAGSMVDVTVAVGKSTSTVRLPAPAASVRVTGTAAAPSLTTTAADGTDQVVPVPVPHARRFTLRTSRAGDHLRVRLRTARDVITLAFAERGGDARVSPASGRTSFNVAVGRHRATVVVAAYDPIARDAWITQCVTKRDQRPHCARPTQGLIGFAQMLFGAFLGSSSEGSSSGSSSDTIVPGESFAAAARAGAPLAPATITPLARGRDADPHLAPGDLNGDGRPDAWTDSWSTKAPELLISTGPGTWQHVPIDGVDIGSAPSVVSDLDGDGRADLISPGGTAITDAFAGGIPARLDLGEKRTRSTRDLEFGGGDDLSVLAGAPSGSIADITGDGRPELVNDAGLLQVQASESAPFGRPAAQAVVLPLGYFDASWLSFADPQPDEHDPASALARAALSHRVVSGRLFTTSPADRNAVSATAQPITIDERRADGSVIASRTFSGAGWPELLDVDPTSGDALVRLVEATACKRRCPEHLLRVAATGVIIADVTFTRRSDQSLQAVFAPDGSDADTGLEVLVTLGDGFATGALQQLGSTLTGTQALSALPTVDLGAKGRGQLVSQLELAVMADGTRWPAAATTPALDQADGPFVTNLLLVQPK